MNETVKLALTLKSILLHEIDTSEKQTYGDTLISVVGEQSYPVRVLQATMGEEKNSLKERLVDIMTHKKTSKIRIFFSVIMLGCVIFGAVYLGAGVGPGKETPPNLYVRTEDGEIYNLTDISKYKTPYVGDGSKVSAIANRLPAPNRFFRQQYTSMKTSNRPYGLTIYYEAASDVVYEGPWPISTPDFVIETNARANAFIAFCMIDNVDEITFAFRTSQSNGKLEMSKYKTTFTFQRASFEEKYGDLSVFSEDLELLQDVLAGK